MTWISEQFGYLDDKLTKELDNAAYNNVKEVGAGADKTCRRIRLLLAVASSHIYDS